jgi:hypothetical protein
VKVRIEEKDPQRLRDLAQAWGVNPVDGQHPDVLAVAIATAYRQAIEKEDRDNVRQA